jgi:hypothetical protein
VVCSQGPRVHATDSNGASSRKARCVFGILLLGPFCDRYDFASRLKLFGISLALWHLYATAHRPGRAFRAPKASLTAVHLALPSVSHEANPLLLRRVTLAGCRVTLYEHRDGTLGVGYGPHVAGRFNAPGIPLLEGVRGRRRNAMGKPLCGKPRASFPPRLGIPQRARDSHFLTVVATTGD